MTPRAAPSSGGRRHWSGRASRPRRWDRKPRCPHSRRRQDQRRSWRAGRRPGLVVQGARRVPGLAGVARHHDRRDRAAGASDRVGPTMTAVDEVDAFNPEARALEGMDEGPAHAAVGGVPRRVAAPVQGPAVRGIDEVEGELTFEVPTRELVQVAPPSLVRMTKPLVSPPSRGWRRRSSGSSASWSGRRACGHRSCPVARREDDARPGRGAAAGPTVLVVAEAYREEIGRRPRLLPRPGGAGVAAVDDRPTRSTAQTSLALANVTSVRSPTGCGICQYQP